VISSEVVRELRNHADERWSEWFPGRSRPRFRAVVMAAGPAHRGRAFVFLVQWDGTPELVFKVAFTDREVGFITQEYTTLSCLYPLLPISMRDQIPTPLEILQNRSSVALAVKALAGRRPLIPNLAGKSSLGGRLLTRRFFRASFNLSRRLGSVGGNGSPLGSAALADTVDRFLAAFSLERDQRLAFEDFRAAVAATHIQWRPGWQHGDLTVGNVLFHRGTIRALDWEHSSSDMEPWFDIAYTPITTAGLAQRQGGLPSFVSAAHRVLRPGAWVSEVLRPELARVWNYPLPVSWGIALTTMKACVRRLERGGRPSLTDLAVALIADPDVRGSLGWIAPRW
jgi:phosphotransferase family enzyme